MVRLQDQDRRLWDAALIARGIQALGAASVGECISSYHLEAGIAACHCLAADDASTDWQQILNLYEALSLLKPSPIVAMNRSVAVARIHGPRAGLEALEKIPDRKSLETQHLYHAIRASFIAKLCNPAEARAAYQLAATLAKCEVERDFLQAEAEC
ncbi:MAG: hypothetical protein HC845_00295 [Akkermansiaceae bacterium]|nr:hypothetical protein [Akkermansiaceae bacterium]